jgi:hypothetical protein
MMEVLGVWIPDENVERAIIAHGVHGDGRVVHLLPWCVCYNCPLCVLCEDEGHS